MDSRTGPAATDASNVDAFSARPGSVPAARLHPALSACARRSRSDRRRLDSRTEARRFRILAFKDGDTVRLWSRNGRDWSREFVAITEAMRSLPLKRVMLDGEVVAHCLEGLPDFHRLLGDGQATACFYAFDLLWLEAQDVRGVDEGFTRSP